MRHLKTAATSAAAAALLLLAACSGGQQVTGKHPCTRHGQPAWCVTVTGGHTVYVPATVYHSTRIGGTYDPGDGDGFRAPDTGDDGHVVIVDAGDR